MKSFRYLTLAVVGMFLVGTPLLADVLPKPVIQDRARKAEYGNQCVEPTDEMRRNHMRYILHQRDETMHRGIRTAKYSFKHCIACHATKDEEGNWIGQNDSRHFCQNCHRYAGVKIDCFECHAGKPFEPDHE
jgi:hypothetical protein